MNNPESLAKRLEHRFEAVFFASRWLTLPLYVGFVVALVLLVAKFVEEVWHGVTHVAALSERDLIVLVLQLVDLSFAANLVIIVMLAGYENFVSRISIDDHEDRPDWLDKIDFAALKLKLIASIVAIAAIDLLRRFMDIDDQALADASADPILESGGACRQKRAQ